MKIFGSKLIFISVIHPDGKAIEVINQEVIDGYTEREIFELNSLSISNGTYIASGMNTYVVKLKNPPIK